MISLNDSNSKIIGSYNYEIQLYPSDIDVFEIHEFDKETVNKIRSICYTFYNSPNTMFLELKAGINYLYDFALQVDMIDGNDVENKFKLVADHYLNNNAIDKEDYDAIIKAINNFNNCTVMEIYLIMRKYMLLRWDILEVMQGFKYIPNILDDGTIDFNNPVKMTLETALVDRSEVNIECAFIDKRNNINEISNYIILTNRDNEPYNVPSLNDPLYITNLLKRGIYLVSSRCIPGSKNNLFKAVKKMYSLTRLEMLMNKKDSTKYKKAFEYNVKIIKMIQSEINIIYYAYSRLKSLVKVFNKNIKYYPKKKWFKYYIASLNEIYNIIDQISDDEMKKSIDKIISYINKSIDGNVILEEVETLLNKISRIINIETVKLLKEYQMYNSDMENLSLISAYFTKYIPNVLNFEGNIPRTPYKFMNRAIPLYYPNDPVK